MAAADWASALGAAMQQFGSNYANYDQDKWRREQEAIQVQRALARDEVEDKRWKAQQDRQAQEDERRFLQDFRENAPFEAPLDDATASRFAAAGMGSLVGNKAPTQTNIPAQFLMEGGEAQTASPGAFLRPSLQQQAAQTQLQWNDPSVKNQLQIEQEAREGKEWERRNAITAKQQQELARINNMQTARPATLQGFAASITPALVSQGVPPDQIAPTIMAMWQQFGGGGAGGGDPLGQMGTVYGANVSDSTLTHLKDLDTDIQEAGGVEPYLRYLLMPSTQQALRAEGTDVRTLVQEAKKRSRQFSGAGDIPLQ